MSPTYHAFEIGLESLISDLAHVDEAVRIDDPGCDHEGRSGMVDLRTVFHFRNSLEQDALGHLHVWTVRRR